MHCSPCYAGFLDARKQLPKRLPRRVEKKIGRTVDEIEQVMNDFSSTPSRGYRFDYSASISSCQRYFHTSLRRFLPGAIFCYKLFQDVEETILSYPKPAR
jgi:hypothetical protein